MRTSKSRKPKVSLLSACVAFVLTVAVAASMIGLWMLLQPPPDTMTQVRADSGYALIPPDSQILGHDYELCDSEFMHLKRRLDSRASTEELIEFYVRNLPPRGWNADPATNERASFTKAFGAAEVILVIYSFEGDFMLEAYTQDAQC